MTTIYRFYDKNDSLLYVGIADDVVTRWATHRRRASWWPKIARAEVTWQPSRSAALAAERSAIPTENPAANVRGFGPTPRQTIRADEDLWLRFDESAAATGSDRSEVLREFMHWHAGDPNAKLPRRPANAVRWTGKNFDEVKSVRPDARLAGEDEPENQIVAGDLLIERVSEPGTWVVVGRNYVVHRREAVNDEG